MKATAAAAAESLEAAQRAWRGVRLEPTILVLLTATSQEVTH